MPFQPKKKPERPGAAPRIEPKGSRRRFVIALGASAGGLEALGRLLAGLPADFAAPILAAIHLDPSHSSHLAPLLQRETRLRVQVARSGQPLIRGTVYVASPDLHLEVRGRRIALTRSPRVRFSRPSIDRLFSSVAKAYGQGAVAVVLSGTGTDGSRGIRDVHEAGGLVIAQEPKSARFRGMPESAVRSGFVDVELSATRIPAALIRAVNQSASPALPAHWPAVISLLRRRVGADFGSYRPSMLKRRLQQRIVATGHSSLASYLGFARNNPAELRRLQSDFLIKVSGFFRDTKEWENLSSKVIRPLFRRLTGSGEVRVWSVGCATGEEAYSLAMLLSEASAGGRHGTFKVFATDLDESALVKARAGLYDATQLGAIRPGRRRRHFEPEGDHFRVRKELRKNVVFGKHNILQDPPLSAMDLIVCRNVLIYLTPERGRAALHRLLKALNPRGFLFLGKSEAVPATERGVAKVPGSLRTFYRLPGQKTMTAPSPTASPSSTGLAFREEPNGSPDSRKVEVALRRVLAETTQVLLFGVDADGRVSVWNPASASFFGPSGRQALGRAAGEVVGAGFWGALKNAADGAAVNGKPVRWRHQEFRTPNHEPRFLDMECIPSNEPGSGGGFIFVGVDATEPHRAEALRGTVIEAHARASAEASESRAALQIAHEALQGTSQEQQTLNEELESRNEELQTVNEELQSLNEELSTLNQEVGIRIAESDRISGYLRTILDLANRIIIGCDLRRRITFWNAGAAKQFQLSETQALGRDVLALVPALDLPEVRAKLVGRGGNKPVQIRRGPLHPDGLEVEIRAVFYGGGRRQGTVLRVSPPARAKPVPRAR